ncbi:MAG: ATP synthase F1 subunit epsilon [Coriobacteriales bacterium]|jgi:F-type H+-transporting ATPase subunit epsilon|nr:ATP synthase F1 subunit epsilon [Coriobacteriales bacterium]
MTTLICDIVTPERQVFAEEVVFVSVPGVEGDIGILPRRAAVMSTLRPGEIRLRQTEDAEPLRFAVAGGYVENDGSKVVVLANRVANLADLAADEVREQRAEAARKLEAALDDDPHKAYLRSELTWYTLLESLLAH